MMKLSTTRKESDFYIARVGSKAGMPMWDNYTSNNAFSVESDNPKNDFQIALHLYRSGKLKYYIVGTCQPSLRKRDLEKFLNSHNVSNNTIKDMIFIDNLINTKELEIEKLKELQSAIASKK